MSVAESSQVIAALRDRYVSGEIEVEEFEVELERALRGGRPSTAAWVSLALEQHRRSHTRM